MTMGLTVDKTSGVTAQQTIKFMKANDYTTAQQEDAKRIHEFLNNKNVRKERQTELTNYLLAMKDESGKTLFTQKEAEKVAKRQIDNEISQKKAQVTVQFIDKEAYDAAVAQAKKDGTDQLYNFKLIKDKKLLDYINGNNLKTIEEKEAHYKKFFKTDDSGNLIKGENGQYIFDSDKFKNEFGQDVGTDNKLQLSEREAAAKKRGIKKGTEKNAIKATGLDYRKDRTNLYRVLAGTAAVASLVFGGATATATSVAKGCGAAIATAKASNYAGAAIGAAVAGGAIPFIHDKDGSRNKRQEAADLFIQQEEPVKSEKTEEPEKEEKPEEPVTPVIQEETTVEDPAAHKHVVEANYTLKTKGVGMSQYVASAYGVKEGSATHKAIMKELWAKNPGLRNKTLAIGDQVYLPLVEVNGNSYLPDLTKQPKGVKLTTEKRTSGRYGGYKGSEYWGAGKKHVNDNETKHKTEADAKAEDAERIKNKKAA